MIRQLTILTLILTICLTSCIQTKTKELKTSTFEIDTSIVAILPNKTTHHWVFKGGKPTKLTSDDLLEIEHILLKCIVEYNPYQEKKFEEINAKHPDDNLDKNNFILDLSRYKRQYVAIINSSGEKEVWVNCFCDAWDTAWKKNLIVADDGGNCFFNLKINLTTGQYYDLMVNGDA